MAKKNNATTNANNSDIINLLRNIVLGTSAERIKRGNTIMGGAGTTRMVRGWVSKIHNNPADEEYELYKGTVDVTEFFEEKFTAEPITYKGVKLSCDLSSNLGFVIVPYLHSEVTIAFDSGMSEKYIVDYTHADMIEVASHTKTRIGATETDELDEYDEDSADYDELEKTGNESYTEYTPQKIITVIRSKNGDIFKQTSESKQHKIEIGKEDSNGDVTSKSYFNVGSEKITSKIKDNKIDITEDDIVIGSESSKEKNPVVRGVEYASLMKDFLLTCSQISTPTLMGTMSPLNFSQFITMSTRVDGTLSNLVFTKE